MDLSEHGTSSDGTPETLDKRLFVQLLVFDIEPSSGPRAMVSALSRRLGEKRIEAVIYADVNDPRGIGRLTWAEDPSQILDQVHPLLGGKRFAALTPRPGWVMLGRTSGPGGDEGLENWLIERPRNTILREDLTWAAWFPLRRTGEFNLMAEKDRGAIIKEQQDLVKNYGAADLVHHVRLACHGMDAEDNDTVVGLAASSLHPISHLVQAMRGTKGASSYTLKMGPFFVGRKIWQNPERLVSAQPEQSAEADAPAAADGAASSDEHSETVDDFVPIDETGEQPPVDGGDAADDSSAGE